MFEETQTKVLGGWNVTVLNETVQVRKKTPQQNHDDYTNESRQQRLPSPIEPQSAEIPRFNVALEGRLGFQTDSVHADLPRFV